MYGKCGLEVAEAMDLLRATSTPVLALNPQRQARILFAGLKGMEEAATGGIFLLP